MKIKFENSTLTIDTELNASVLGDRARASVQDEKGNDVYTISKASGAVGSIGDNYISCNAITTEGNLAVVIALGSEATIADVKKAYADQLLNAQSGIVAVAQKAEAKKAAVDELFAGLE